MYVNSKELADYLGVTLQYVLEQVEKGNIKAVYDGEEYLFNKEQFTWYKEQLDLKRKQIAHELSEPLPDDWDAKDED
ncbi:excisionase family DNA-binding protein [Alkalihalophilus sp. As8PL]|uniref:Excisionase family DNA-binding protein n=1 Tax=Alkalihalophilus sp. As8PL TaxID=3237103 RepID=A0AB39BSJ4_9BACI